MKRTVILMAIVAITAMEVFAQGGQGLTSALANFRDNWVRPIFPIIVGIVFIIGVLTNLGKFFGEERDIKQGIINIAIYVGVILVISGIFAAINNISL